MSIKVVTLLKKIDSLSSKENAAIIIDFYNYLREKGSSENHIMNCLKVVIEYTNYINETRFCDIDKKEYVISFLNIKIKDGLIDPDKRWITTWNHFLNRLKLFFRWLYNYHKSQNQISYSIYEGCNHRNRFTPNLE